MIHTSVLHVVKGLLKALGLRDVELLLLLFLHHRHALEHADSLLDIVQHRQVANAYQQLCCSGCLCRLCCHNRRCLLFLRANIQQFPDIPTKGTSFFISTDLKDIKDFATKVALASRSLESQESVDLLFPRRFIGLRSQGGKEFFPHRGYNAVFPLPTASHK